MRANLFQSGDFTLASGLDATWKIECDALTDDDIDCLAIMIKDILPAPFGKVEGVPRGGDRLAEALRPYATGEALLIVDDVLTTGGSMEQHRAGRPALGAVIFSRGAPLRWVTPLFQMGHRRKPEAVRRVREAISATIQTLDDEAQAYAFQLCRMAPGPCFCGAHITQTR